MKKDENGTIVGTTKKAPFGYGYCGVCHHPNVDLKDRRMLAKHGCIELGGECPGSDLPAGKRPTGKAPERFTIVIAWVVVEFEVVNARRADLGESPILKQTLGSKAIMWLNRGTEKDLEKAKIYAKSQKGQRMGIFTYHTTEKDPLGRAKKEIKELIVRYGWIATDA
jgi:hypothetical protein